MNDTASHQRVDTPTNEKPDERRATAAELLRQVRRCPWHDIEQPLRWAISYLPDSRPIVRMKIKWLIEQNDLDEAVALLAQALKKFDDDGGLRALSALCQLRLGNLPRAASEIHQALQRRPNHRRTAYLAGEIAAAHGDIEHAIEITRNALPGDNTPAGAHDTTSARTRLIEWLIEAGRLDEADDEIRRIEPPVPAVRARLLQARGQWQDAERVVREAIDLLEDDDDQTQRDELLALRLTLLEEMANRNDLLETVGAVNAHTPRAVIHAGLALLTLGEFARAVALLQRLVPQFVRFHHRAQHVQMVAAGVSGDVDQAESVLEQLESVGALDSEFVAECWRRALFGGLMRQQIDPAHNSDFMHTGQLRPLLIDALAVLQSVEQHGTTHTGGTTARHRTPTTHQQDLNTCIETCHQLLNRVG